MTVSLLSFPFICISTTSYYSIFFSFSEQIRVGLYSKDVFLFLFYFCFTLSGNREIKSTRIGADADVDAVDWRLDITPNNSSVIGKLLWKSLHFTVIVIVFHKTVLVFLLTLCRCFVVEFAEILSCFVNIMKRKTIVLPRIWFANI